ncbi:MAG: anaerobic ribonucleoside-triphosphate reductase activating protein [Candidatus Diapherotrites archaeon]|nr:anaerobic ribonucleoside-triphosphate reductase activating protein [Candidatus Diapherotrites archaeon]
MDFVGLQKTTLLDYPDKIACIFFTPGCNFRCGFCYNKQLVLTPNTLPKITEQEALEFLEKRKKYLEAIVITGGEPTLHWNELKKFVLKAKKLGYLIKLDSNGTNPEAIKEAIEEKLIDYIAMDIKSSLENYSKAVGTEVNTENIKKSIELIMNSGIDYEFRSTIIPEIYSNKDAIKISELINGAKKYFLQQFVPAETMIDESFKEKKRYSFSEAVELKKILEKTIQKVELRGFE